MDLEESAASGRLWLTFCFRSARFMNSRITHGQSVLVRAGFLCNCFCNSLGEFWTAKYQCGLSKVPRFANRHVMLCRVVVRD